MTSLQGKTGKAWFRLGWLLVLVAGAFLIYSEGIWGKRFGDDYAFVFSPLPESPWYFFANKNPHHSLAYRPLEATFLLLVQQRYGMEVLPIHAVQIALHALISGLVFLWIQANAGGTRAAILGSLFMLLSPVNASAVLGLDTLSQMGSALFGTLCLWALHRAFSLVRSDGSRGEVLRSGWFVASVAAFALALLSKENSVGFGPALFALAWYHEGLRKRAAKGLASAVVLMTPFVAIVLAYFWVRHQVVDIAAPSFHSGNLGLSLGFNIVANVALFVVAPLLPTSTVDFYVAAKEGDAWRLAALAAPAGVLAVALAMGLRRSPRRRSTIGVIVLAMVLLLPMTLFNHVSELYVYTAMPLIAVVVGLGLAAFYESWAGGLWKRVAAMGLLAVWIGLQWDAIAGKARDMVLQGERTTQWIEDIEGFVDRVPLGGTLLLVHRPTGQVGYSVFRYDGLRVLENCTAVVNRRSGRNDFKVRLLNPEELGKAESARPYLALTLRDGRVVEFDGLQ